MPKNPTGKAVANLPFNFRIRQRQQNVVDKSFGHAFGIPESKKMVEGVYYMTYDIYIFILYIYILINILHS